METRILCRPEHIRYGQNMTIAKLFGVDKAQVTRWDKGKTQLSEKVLIRAARCGLTKGQILDVYDLRREDYREDYQKGAMPSDKWKDELNEIVESLTN